MIIFQAAQAQFRRRLTSAIALPLVLTIAFAGTLFGQLKYLLWTTEWVDHTDRVIAQANETQKVIVDMETGLRGYLITGNPEFLQPYELGIASIDSKLNTLNVLISDNRSQEQRLTLLRSRFKNWQIYSQKMIALRQQNGNYRNNSINLEGKDQMDDIRREFSEIIETEAELRNSRSKRAQTTTQIILGSRLVFILGLGVLIAFFTRSQLIAVSKSYTKALVTAEEQNAALQASEEQFRIMVEGIKDYAIFMLDPKGYIINWNEGAERIKGYQEAEIVGQHFSVLFTAAEVENGEPEKELQIAASEGKYECEGYRLRKDGSLFWVNTILTALKDQTGSLRGFVKITRDITERKQAEAALKRSEERFRATFEQAAVGMAHVSLDGKWLLVNQKLCEILGYSREELQNLDFQNITYSEDLDGDLEYVRQMLTNEIQTYSMEKRYIRKDGSLVWCNLTVALVGEISDAPRYFIPVIEDITERKRSEEALHRSTQRLTALQEIDRAILRSQSLTEIVGNALLQMRHVIPYQQSLTVLFDWHKREAEIIARISDTDTQLSLGEIRPITDFIPGDILKEELVFYLQERANLNHCPPILKAESSQTPTDCLSVPLIVNSSVIGEVILLTFESENFSSEYGAIINEVANQLAIAIEQAQLREQLQKKAEELEHRVKERTIELQEANSQLEAFAYSVSHDLRAPLRAMQGFSQALEEDYGDQLDEIAHDYIERIVTAAKRMDTLIYDLLAYSRLTRIELQLQPIDLNSIVENVLNNLEQELRENKVQVVIESLSFQVMSHRITLIQVITNLVTNAIKFVAPGVQPQIKIWAEERVNTLTGSVQESNSAVSESWVRLWIKDNGIGINPEYYDRIFRVFERLHGVEVYPGTGIGLAIVRKGIERMGGKVGVESQLGQGSSFWIELPKPIANDK